MDQFLLLSYVIDGLHGSLRLSIFYFPFAIIDWIAGTCSCRKRFLLFFPSFFFLFFPSFFFLFFSFLFFLACLLCFFLCHGVSSRCSTSPTPLSLSFSQLLSLSFSQLLSLSPLSLLPLFPQNPENKKFSFCKALVIVQAAFLFLSLLSMLEVSEETSCFFLSLLVKSDFIVLSLILLVMSFSCVL